MVSSFQCYECGKGFEEEVFLFLHQYSTHDKTPFKCDKCGDCGVGQQRLYNHMKKHREEKLKIYKCHLCPFEEQNLSIFQKHAELHTVEPEKPDEKSKYCEPCGKAIFTENYFDHYMKAHVQETDQLFTCIQCDFKFTRKNLLVDHENTVHDDKGHRSILETLAILKEQVTDVQAKQTFRKINEQRTNLLEETELSAEKSHQECDICHKFMTKPSLQRHMKTIHGAWGKKWYCQDCGKCLQTKSRLKQHQFVHTLGAIPEEGFACTMCKYVTTSKEYLRDHKKRAHIKTEGSWVCIMGKCTKKPKSFINHLLLEKHQQDHTNIACPECGKMFGAKRNMVRHMSTNSCSMRKQQQIV